MSVAANSGRIAFNVFEKGEFHSSRWTRRIRGHGGGAAARRREPGHAAAVDRVSGPVSIYLANDTLGLPKDTVFTTTPYSASLTLDYVSRPDIAVGASSQYGVGVAGGTALFWSDMLGEHNLTTVLSINGTLKDIGGGIGYQNTRRRLNWGVGRSRSRISSPRTPPTSAPTRTFRRWWTLCRHSPHPRVHRELTGIISYPLSRVERLDFLRRRAESRLQRRAGEAITTTSWANWWTWSATACPPRSHRCGWAPPAPQWYTTTRPTAPPARF